MTTNLVAISNEALGLLNKITSESEVIKADPSRQEQVSEEIKKSHKAWLDKALNYLVENGLLLELEQFLKPKIWAADVIGVNKELNDVYLTLEIRRNLIIEFAKDIEKNQKKNLIILSVEDFDNFKNIRKAKSSEAVKYAKDYFLEDDVENAFLEALGEPFKEQDSGSEIRDLFTDRIKYQGERIPTAFMFKGRGVKGELTIGKCGKNGDQLIKLSKNTSAKCFIVQHTNKIGQDVREALQDHILMNSKHPTVYICFIDGLDTARFLKSTKVDLENYKK